MRTNRISASRSIEVGFLKAIIIGILFLAAVVGGLSGCGKPGEPESPTEETWEQVEPPRSQEEDEPSTTEPPQETSEDLRGEDSEQSEDTSEPARPEGTVPAEVVGTWRGGPGGKSGYDLTITTDGRYELSHKAFIEQGYTAGDASTLLLRPVSVSGQVERSERVVRWSIQPSSVVDVLTILDPVDGEYSYVRTG